VGVGKKAEGVEEDHDESRERQRYGDPRSARATPEERDQADRDPEVRPREPTRELIEAEPELGVAPPVRERTEKRVALADDRVEPRLLRRLAEDEVMVRRRRPHVADAVVGT
jgi:hypothetical protein